MHRPRATSRFARRRIAWAAGVLILMMAGTAAAGPARIAARLPAEMQAGEPERLEVLLLDEQGRLVPAPRELRVVVRGAETMLDGDELRFPAGEEAIAVELRPPKAGAWALEVVVEGFESVWLPCVAVESPAVGEDGERPWVLASAAEPLRRVREHEPWARPDTPVGAMAAPPRAVRAEPIGVSAESDRARVRQLLRSLPEETGAAQEALAFAVAQDPEIEESVRRLEAVGPLAGVAAEQEGPPGEAESGDEPPPEAVRDPAAFGVGNPRGPTETLTRVLELQGLRDLRPVLVQAGPATGEDEEPEQPGGPGLETVSGGELRLIPGEVERGPGQDGTYRVPVFGIWYLEGQPARRAEPPLELELIADPSIADLEMEPRSARLEPGEMRTTVELVSRSRGEVVLRALYPGGESTPATVRFLPPRPESLAIVELPPRLRSLGVVELPVAVRLLDGTGRPTVAAGDLAVEIEVFGGAELDRRPLVIEKGRGEAVTTVSLKRFGEQRLTARAEGLTAGEASLRLAFDWAILAWALAGSLVGALVPLLRARRRRGGWRIARDAALALVAAAVLLLLCAFGLLALLENAELSPFWAGVAALPLSNQAAAFLIGFVAGFGSDALFQRLRKAI